MGVTGLWPIVQPCARPIKLETLNRKRLAVDASIWIYQFLKAVRDKEGNALRNSHIVGFFRRICKLLFFGIKPVFVFDGGAPALKRQTVLGRKRRREGRREDAVRTAGKLLAVQMQRRLEEDEEKRKREKKVRGREAVPVEEEIPDVDQLVYVDELGMSKQERLKNRKFTKKDAYHLPDLDGSIANMGQPNDPRIMSVEELEEYARQFNSGEDINLYDFSKIDFNGEFFQSLPAVDRYNILNAARLRSRLRMGLSKEQLEEMFPDRMAFSRFQIERVRERNELTQRLMHLNGMNDDAMFGVGGGRIAGEKDREYVLVKNDGVEGGWALGVVTTDKSLGERSKPIDVDSLSRDMKQNESEELEDEDDFEDVPIEGLNRLPRVKNVARVTYHEDTQARELVEKRQRLYASRQNMVQTEDVNSLFVDAGDVEDAPRQRVEDAVSEEQRDLDLAIAMSLENQYSSAESEVENASFEDVPMPVYEQKAVEAPRPLSTSNGRMVAHIVNNRANAAVPKRRATSISSDDDDMDLQAALAASRKLNTASKEAKPALVPSNVKNPFDGPLPFEKLDFKKSLFGSRKAKTRVDPAGVEDEGNDELAGGFQRDEGGQAAKPLPPWMIKESDIRSDVQEQRARDIELNAEDRARALEEEQMFQRHHGVIEVDSSDDESDVELVDARPVEPKAIDLTVDGFEPSPPLPRTEINESSRDLAEKIRVIPPVSEMPQVRQPSPVPENMPQVTDDKDDLSAEEYLEWSESDQEDVPTNQIQSIGGDGISKAKSLPLVSEGTGVTLAGADVPEPAKPKSPSPLFEGFDVPDATPFSAVLVQATSQAAPDNFGAHEADIVSDVDFNEFSDPEDEELLAQLAQEAEEHARFASTLNNKSAQENREAYERELKALRNQQKKDRRDADEVSHIMITECQALLRLFGLPYITAPMEAEAQCAELVRLGLVDGIVTDDSDIFLFGGTRVYKNMFNSNKFVECYLATDLDKELTLSRHQLISIAHLLGSDYTEGLPGIGPVGALEIVSEFPSSSGLEEFKSWWSDVQLNSRPKEADAMSSFRKKFRRAQATKLFLPPGFPSPAVTEAYLKPDVDSTPEPFQWGVPDLDNLRSFLMATIGWSQERTDEVLVPVIKDMNRRATEGTQSNITRFFEGGVGVGARTEGFAPRVKEKESVRMKEAVKRLKAKKQKGLSERATFAEEAAEWAKRNELSEEAEKAKRERKKKEREEKRLTKERGKENGRMGKGKEKGKKCAVDANADANAVSEMNDEAGEEGGCETQEMADDSEGEYTTKTNDKGKGKRKATSRNKPRKRARFADSPDEETEMED